MRRLCYLTLIWTASFVALVGALDDLLGGRSLPALAIYSGAYWLGLTTICVAEEIIQP
jgi:hypothetical protein